jgi:hypothetical protein
MKKHAETIKQVLSDPPPKLDTNLIKTFDINEDSAQQKVTSFLEK